MLEVNIKRYLRITHIFSSAVWHLPREIFDLAIGSLSEARRLKKQKVIAEKKALKKKKRKHLKYEMYEIFINQ